MYMEKEQLLDPNSGEFFGVSQLRTVLFSAGLLEYDHPAATEVVTLLDSGEFDEIGFYGPQDAEAATNHIAAFAKTTAHETKEVYTAQTVLTYPIITEEAESVPSMRDFVKHQSSGERREELRGVYKTTVDSFRSALIRAFNSDRCIKTAARVSIPQDQIEAQLESGALLIRDELARFGDTISTLLSQRVLITKQTGSRIMRLLKRESAVSIQGAEYPDRLAGELEALATFLKQTKDVSIGESTASYFFPDIERQIYELMIPRYSVLTTKSMERLRPALALAYVETKRAARANTAKHTGSAMVRSEVSDSLEEPLSDPEETPMIVLIAYTDKNNQEEVYHGFGVPRRQARNNGVGAV